MYRSADGLHMQDIESGLYYSLWSEIPSRGTFDHRAFSALKLYIDVLSKVLTILSSSGSLGFLCAFVKF